MKTVHILPRYPIYVPSKGRAAKCLTAKFLTNDGVDFRLVVEPQEADAYAAALPRAKVLILPFQDLGQGSIPARNFIWEHARANGVARHWVIDDNIRNVRRLYRGRRIPCASGPAFVAVEDFTDRYENIGISGFAYQFFAFGAAPAYWLNVHVYSCMLIDTTLPFRWRGRYNEDTDLTLQVLSAGLCTVLVNVFMIYKVGTMVMKGGNTEQLYQGDGRVKMARSLERQWPGVVATARRFKRPQHVVADGWRKFDTPLKRRADVDFSQFDRPNEYGLDLLRIDPAKDLGDRLGSVLETWQADHEIGAPPGQEGP